MDVRASTVAIGQVLEGTLQNPQLVWDMAARASRLHATLTVTGADGRQATVRAAYAGASPNAAGRHFDGRVRLRGLLDGRDLTVSEIL